MRRILCWAGFGHKPNKLLALCQINYNENKYGKQYKCMHCDRWIIDMECDRLNLRVPKLAYPLRSIRQALRYASPKRLTLKSNPRVHAWLWWNF